MFLPKLTSYSKNINHNYTLAQSIVALIKEVTKENCCFVYFNYDLVFTSPTPIHISVEDLKEICDNATFNDKLIKHQTVFLDDKNQKNNLWLFKSIISEASDSAFCCGFFSTNEIDVNYEALQHVVNIIKSVLPTKQNISKSEDENVQRIINNSKSYALLLNQIPIGLLTVNAETYKIANANSHFLKLFKVKHKNEITDKLIDEVKLFSKSTAQQLLDTFLREGEVSNKPVLCFKSNTELFWCLVSMQQILLNNKKFIIYNYYDVTDIKNLESELDKATKIAEKALEMQTLFLANVSHEIRTPINGILGFTELMQQSTLTNEQKDYLHSIAISGKNLVSVVNDILDSTKIEAGLITIENISFSLTNIILEIEKVYKKQTELKGIKFEINSDEEIPHEIFGDPTRLTQIVSNLVGNALKFTTNGSIKLTTRLYQKNKENIIVQISVKDTGIGIEKNKLETVFEKFVQEDVSTTRKFGGSGLGLSIVKKLIEIHKGSIEVKSEKNVGTEFVCYLPYNLTQNTQQNTSINTTSVSFLKGKKILLVEDNEINQKLTSAILKREGAIVTITQNGVLAINLLQNITYDLILMDIQMPELDGISATIQIRNNLQITTPIIAMTANVLPGERAVCIKSGMNDYLSKPFNVNSLLSILAKHLTIGADELFTKNTNENSLKHCNLSYLIDFSNGNSTFIKEMIELFLEQNPLDIKQLVLAAENKNKQGMLALFHKLKTNLGFIGFNAQLLDRIKFTETNSFSLKECLQLTTALSQECVLVQKELKLELEKIKLVQI